jgi:hypothetical protein
MRPDQTWVAALIQADPGLRSALLQALGVTYVCEPVSLTPI